MATKITKKRCSKCKAEKPVTGFYKDKTRKDGLNCQCKECHKRYNQEHEKEKLVYNKQYNQDHKEGLATRHRQYKQDHKEEMVVYDKQYYRDHRTVKLAQRKQYNETEVGRQVRRKAEQKRRALKAKANIEDFRHEEIFERDNYICQHCGRKTRPDFKNQYHPLYPNLDHIIPLSKGGPHTRLNTQCLCHQCNMEKHATGKGDQLRMFG